VLLRRDQLPFLGSEKVGCVVDGQFGFLKGVKVAPDVVLLVGEASLIEALEKLGFEHERGHVGSVAGPQLTGRPCPLTRRFSTICRYSYLPLLLTLGNMVTPP